MDKNSLSCLKVAAALNSCELSDELKLSKMCDILSKFDRRTGSPEIANVHSTRKSLIAFALIALIALSAFLSGQCSICASIFFRSLYGTSAFELEPCALDVPRSLQDIFLPPFNCSICSDLIEVPSVAAISPDDFAERFAYSGLPVVVTDGALNWTARSVFSFDFFRDLYDEDSPVLDSSTARDCQFFPYKSGFRSLEQVFAMDAERRQQPWYVGWSNCDASSANYLRRFYKRPYFLPTSSESSRMDWIFMGTPGYGAHVHVDKVGYPSWQAQVKGRKRWTLEAPPECSAVCSALEVVVEPGQTIVLDTDKWYHGTYILEGDLSITIGSEFD